MARRVCLACVVLKCIVAGKHWHLYVKTLIARLFCGLRTVWGHVALDLTHGDTHRAGREPV